jgi:pyridoxamine 5'-phosphate oxidase
MHVKADESNPYEWIERWVAEENSAPLFGILATVDDQCKPHTRTIAIREINKKGILFFTQKGSKKVQQLENNPSFWPSA